MLLKQTNIYADVTLEATKEGLLVRPQVDRRAEWDNAFKLMNGAGNDEMLDAETPTSWDNTEWEWK